MRAGTAKQEITCREEGAAAYRLSEKTMPHIPRELWDKKIEIDDPLFLKVLVLEDGPRRTVLIAMDTTAIGARTITQEILGDSADDFMPKLRERLQVEAGISPDGVTVCASHTHPPGRLLCNDDEQLDKAAQAVKDAISRLEPVQIGAGSVNQERLTYNRTLMMKDGTDYTLRSCNPYPPDEEVEALRPVDPEVGVLRLDRMDGTPLAVVYNFGAHLLIGQPTANITADFPGVASEHVETVLGNNSMAFFIQGAGGDVSEAPQLDRDHPKWRRNFGITLGESVLDAFRKIRPGEAGLNVVSERVEFPLRKDIPQVVAALRSEQASLAASTRYTALNFKTFLPLYLKYELNPEYPLHSAYRYLHAQQTGDPGYEVLDRRNRLAVRKYLQSMRAMERIARNEEKIATLLRQQEIIEELGVDAVEAEVQGIRIGECAYITAPMEVLVATALKVKAASPFPHTFVASNTNGYFHYAPPASYYSRGGYEVTECLLAPEWEAVFDRTVASIFERLRCSNTA